MLLASVQPSSSWFCADLSIMLPKIPDLVPAENFVPKDGKLGKSAGDKSIYSVTYLFHFLYCLLVS